MSKIVINISDMKCSTDPTDVMATYSLGSCLGITAYDPHMKVGGMVHALLPSAKAAPDKARENPFMFVTSGIIQLVKTLFTLGAKRQNLIFKLAGGSDMRGDTMFRTGLRNVEAAKGLLRKNNVVIRAQDVGGCIPRTMFLHMETGDVVVRTFGKDKTL